MSKSISLDDKYALEQTTAYMTGVEALVRLPIVQHQRDMAAGLDTAGFISGYRGSPLGTVDQSMWKAKQWLDEHNIKFQPGVNEDLAATSVWGTQQVHSVPNPKYDGVFAMWYGKGPGVDRSMDPIKHANFAGTEKLGGVLAIAGDDHACKSSSSAHQSEHMFIAAGIPVLNPADVQEVLDFGIYGWALSRYSGCWVALKAVTECMDSSMTVDIDPNRVTITLPTDFKEPDGGLNTQWPTTYLNQERLLHNYRLPAAQEFARVNNLNQIRQDCAEPHLGIATTGKAYLDVLEALDYLGIDSVLANKIGLRIYKIGMSWPLESSGTLQFAQGLKEILVVEEKRNIIEDQILKQLYHLPDASRPMVVGKFDEHGHELVSGLAELSPMIVARAIGRRIDLFYQDAGIAQRLEQLDLRQKKLAESQSSLMRKPYFCSGCPHNTSTKIPAGSIGMAGIGCHAMVKWMGRNTQAMTHMGGEGATWIGMSPFTETNHVFQNLGDGTYFHSGILAVRAAIASGVNITYKLLFNDAVAMTGGQPVDGTLTLPSVVKQLLAEGVERLAVVAEDVSGAKAKLQGISNITVHERREFDKLQIDIRETKGTSVIVFDQTCAAEKRRRRKRGVMPESATRVYINPAVCEGCGDCSTKSNCLSILPNKTELGVKRQIDQSACNSDFSCLEGFCPSFVTVTGGTIKKKEVTAKGDLDILLPEPALPNLERPWNILITGIGGTGILTVGSVLAMAAHIEGKGCTTLNQTGLAQKFGSVSGHIRIARAQEDIHAVRITDGAADLMLGCDLLVSALSTSLERLDTHRSHAIVNSYESTTADFIHDKNYKFPGAALQEILCDGAGSERAHFVNATQIARDIMGNTIGSNMFLFGYAYQLGLIPVGEKAIFQALALNNVSVEFNQKAFTWGRRAVVNPEAVKRLAGPDSEQASQLNDFEEIVQWRYQYLIKYQNKQYAEKYLKAVNRVREQDKQFISVNGTPAAESLSIAVARNLFKLMAYKDEYEVARLYTDTDFITGLKAKFDGPIKLNFHLSPPLLAAKDPLTGNPVKYRVPGLVLGLFCVLKHLKVLRGTRFDPVGMTKERRAERQLIIDYENDLQRLVELTTTSNNTIAVELASLPSEVRGFGHVKLASIEEYQVRRDALFQKLQAPELTVVECDPSQ